MGQFLPKLDLATRAVLFTVTLAVYVSTGWTSVDAGVTGVDVLDFAAHRNVVSRELELAIANLTQIPAASTRATYTVGLHAACVSRQGVSVTYGCVPPASVLGPPGQSVSRTEQLAQLNPMTGSSRPGFDVKEPEPVVASLNLALPPVFGALALALDFTAIMLGATRLAAARPRSVAAESFAADGSNRRRGSNGTRLFPMLASLCSALLWLLVVLLFPSGGAAAVFAWLSTMAGFVFLFLVPLVLRIVAHTRGSSGGQGPSSPAADGTAARPPKDTDTIALTAAPGADGGAVGIPRTGATDMVAISLSMMGAAMGLLAGCSASWTVQYANSDLVASDYDIMANRVGSPLVYVTCGDTTPGCTVGFDNYFSGIVPVIYMMNVSSIILAYVNFARILKGDRSIALFVTGLFFQLLQTVFFCVCLGVYDGASGDVLSGYAALIVGVLMFILSMVASLLSRTLCRKICW
jgi:hypothetical protein